MAEEKPVYRVRPTALPIEAYLHNPHRGCSTFQRFNGDPIRPRGPGWTAGPVHSPEPPSLVADGYLPTTIAYLRWYWRLIEPKRGEYDFTVIEEAMKVAGRRGQTVVLRLMSVGSPGQQTMAEWYEKEGALREEAPHGKMQTVPEYDSPEYLEAWGGLIREFGRRYNGHPLMEAVDMSYIGPWGEGAGRCSKEQIWRFTEIYNQAFSDTPRMALVSGEAMRAAVATGAGWRCDCFGDLTNHELPYASQWGPSPGWNHHYDCYPREIVMCGASEAWKNGPIQLETCWVPGHWEKHGFDIDFILEQGLKFHASHFMPKSTPLPEQWMDKFKLFCNQIGYRFILRQAAFDQQTSAGGSFLLKIWIENVGVAPIYHRYDFALRFRQGDREEIVAFDDIDIRKWLPGDAWIEREVRIPQGFAPGPVQLAAALVHRKTHEPRVHFAVKETSDGWVDLRGMELTA